MGRIKRSDLLPGTLRRLEYAPFHVLIANVDGIAYAIDDTCNHAGESLSKGDLHGCAIHCPAHGYEFDVRSGTLLSPAGLCPPQRTFDVVVEGDDFVVYDDPLVISFV